jgi:ribulose-5-phosphate 4-epimerase/fuculose-1-phosphate aldolase
MSIQKFIQLSKYVAHQIDVVQGAGGNSSVKMKDETMLIKASGMLLKEIETKAAYVKVDISKILQVLKNEYFDVKNLEDINNQNETVKAIGNMDLKPSMETSFHCLYHKYVLHTHNVYANVYLCSDHFAVLENCFDEVEKYSVSLLKDYYTPGAELSWHIYNQFRFKESFPNVTFLPNHGVIYSHNDVDELLKIYDDVQEKILGLLQFNQKSYPNFTLITEKDLIKVNCTFLFDIWKSIDWHIVLNDLLFPDQAIYINEKMISDINITTKVFIDFNKNTIVINANQREAEGIIETLIAYFFINDLIIKNKFEPLTINFEFDKLRNMSSEQYRKEQFK